MSRSNYDKPFYVDVGTSIVAIRCASNHDVVVRYDHVSHPHTLKLAEDVCDRMNKEAEIRNSGDCAKLRETMLAIKAGILKRREENAWYISDSDILEKIDAALAATPETETGKSSREDLLASALARVVEHAHGLDGDTIWTHAIRGEDYDFARLVLSETGKQ